tara:strand:+ start:3201 stop:3689 length:489 start_codon:yes stop_codon:yes gene_type:complete
VSHWIWPTTADLGLRAMAPTVERVFAEAALGVLAAMDAQGANASRVHHGEWTAMLNASEGRTDLDLLLLAWLDEVLYQAQTKSRWMLSADVHITQDKQGARLRAMVAFVSANEMVRGVEVKAISSHGLTLQAVQAGATLPGKGEDMPSLVGPAWYADVLLDV